MKLKVTLARFVAISCCFRHNVSIGSSDFAWWCRKVEVQVKAITKHRQFCSICHLNALPKILLSIVVVCSDQILCLGAKKSD